MREGLQDPGEVAGLLEEVEEPGVAGCGGVGQHGMQVAVVALEMEAETEMSSGVLQRQPSRGNLHCPEVPTEPSQPGEGEDAVLKHRSPPGCLFPLRRDK